MEKKTSYASALPVLFGFFVMGFCDVVGITSAHFRIDDYGSIWWCSYKVQSK